MSATDSGLSISGDRQTGQDVRGGNVTAVMTLANVLRSSLGPQGLDKMVVDDTGDVTITNDGATILQKLEIQHPAAKVLVELAEQQDREVGDGTTSVVIIAAELLKRGNELVKQHIHPTNVIAGYRIAMKEAVRYIRENLGVSLDNITSVDVLKQVATTTLSSKFLGAENDLFTQLVVDAVRSIKTINPDGKAKYPVGQINVLKSHGRSSAESMLIKNGYALPLARVAQGCPTRVTPAKIALLDFDLKKFTMRTAEIAVENPDELEKIRQKEMDITKKRIESILSTGANVIMTTKGIDDMSIKYLVDAGCMGVRRVEKSDMKRIAKVTGARIQITLANLDGDEDFDASSLGHCDVVEEQRVGDNDFIFVRDAKDGAKACTVLLRGANEFMLDESERSLHDALMAVCKTAESKSIVPGGGACEVAVSLHLEQFARTLESKEQLAVTEFAEALLTIPTMLTCNAALDSIELLSKLRKKHYEAITGTGGPDCKYYGLDLLNNCVRNSISAGVVEPMVSKLKSLKFATEAAITIIRIDDLIKLASDEPQQ